MRVRRSPLPRPTCTSAPCQESRVTSHTRRHSGGFAKNFALPRPPSLTPKKCALWTGRTRGALERIAKIRRGKCALRQNHINVYLSLDKGRLHRCTHYGSSALVRDLTICGRFTMLKEMNGTLEIRVLSLWGTSISNSLVYLRLGTRFDLAPHPGSDFVRVVSGSTLLSPDRLV